MRRSWDEPAAHADSAARATNVTRRKTDARSAGAAAAKSGETGVRGALFLDAKGATTTRSTTGLAAAGGVVCDACDCVRGRARGGEWERARRVWRRGRAGVGDGVGVWSKMSKTSRIHARSSKRMNAAPTKTAHAIKIAMVRAPSCSVGTRLIARYGVVSSARRVAWWCAQPPPLDQSRQ